MWSKGNLCALLEEVKSCTAIMENNMEFPSKIKVELLYDPTIIPKENKIYISKVKVKLLSHILLSVTPWTVAHQAPLSMGFSRQEYWSGLPFPSLLYIKEISIFSCSLKNYS